MAAAHQCQLTTNVFSFWFSADDFLIARYFSLRSICIISHRYLSHRWIERILKARKKNFNSCMWKVSGFRHFLKTVSSEILFPAINYHNTIIERNLEQKICFNDIKRELTFPPSSFEVLFSFRSGRKTVKFNDSMEKNSQISWMFLIDIIWTGI